MGDGFSGRSLSQFSFLSGNRFRVKRPGVFSAQPCPAAHLVPFTRFKAGLLPRVATASGSLLPCSTACPPRPAVPTGSVLGRQAAGFGALQCFLPAAVRRVRFLS